MSSKICILSMAATVVLLANAGGCPAEEVDRVDTGLTPGLYTGLADGSTVTRVVGVCATGDLNADTLTEPAAQVLSFIVDENGGVELADDGSDSGVIRVERSNVRSQTADTGVILTYDARIEFWDVSIEERVGFLDASYRLVLREQGDGLDVEVVGNGSGDIDGCAVLTSIYQVGRAAR